MITYIIYIYICFTTITTTCVFVSESQTPYRIFNNNTHTNKAYDVHIFNIISSNLYTYLRISNDNNTIQLIMAIPVKATQKEVYANFRENCIPNPLPLNQQSKVPKSFSNNKVTTSKYTILNFIPKFLFESFGKFANFYFLVVSVAQCVADFNLFGVGNTTGGIGGGV